MFCAGIIITEGCVQPIIGRVAGEETVNPSPVPSLEGGDEYVTGEPGLQQERLSAEINGLFQSEDGENEDSSGDLSSAEIFVYGQSIGAALTLVITLLSHAEPHTRLIGFCGGWAGIFLDNERELQQSSYYNRI
jgi:hypothetical protein